MMKKVLPRIKTNIKFYQGLNGNPEMLYGFVTNINGSWRGCREDYPTKKIVLIDRDIKHKIIPNMLYSCSLMPVLGKECFIAKSANLVRFEATIITECNAEERKFNVSVKFGCKTLTYDPTRTDDNRLDINDIAERLKNTMELKDSIEVAETFVNNAILIRQQYNQFKAQQASQYLM